MKALNRMTGGVAGKVGNAIKEEAGNRIGRRIGRSMNSADGALRQGTFAGGVARRLFK